MDRKGKLGITIPAVLGIIVAVVFLVNLIPTYSTAIDDADYAILACNGATNTILNESYNPALCCNQTNCASNETASTEGLNSGQEALLLIGITMLVLGFVVYAVKGSGVAGN